MIPIIDKRTWREYRVSLAITMGPEEVADRVREILGVTQPLVFLARRPDGREVQIANPDARTLWEVIQAGSQILVEPVEPFIPQGVTYGESEEEVRYGSTQEYFSTGSDETPPYNYDLTELDLYHYHNRKSSRASPKLRALPTTLSNLGQVSPLILQLVQDFRQIAQPIRYSALLLRSFVSGVRYAISIYVGIITEVLKQFSSTPVDEDELRGFVRAVTIYMIGLTLTFFLYRAAFYPALFLGLFVLPMKFRDLGVVSLTAVIALIFLAYALFTLNSLVSHFVKVLP